MTALILALTATLEGGLYFLIVDRRERAKTRAWNVRNLRGRK